VRKLWLSGSGTSAREKTRRQPQEPIRPSLRALRSVTIAASLKLFPHHPRQDTATGRLAIYLGARTGKPPFATIAALCIRNTRAPGLVAPVDPAADCHANLCQRREPLPAHQRLGERSKNEGKMSRGGDRRVAPDPPSPSSSRPSLALAELGAIVWVTSSCSQFPGSILEAKN
jgi:hypothetical protein